MRRYYEDNWNGRIYSTAELGRLIEDYDVARSQVPRRFRTLPEVTCRLLEQAELIAAAVDSHGDRR